MSSEHGFLDACDDSSASAEACGRDWLRLTQPGLDFLALTCPAALLRGGNQTSKSTTLACDALDFARGVHRWDQTHRPPVEVVVCGPSWEQMEPLQRRLWDLVPRGELDERAGFDAGRGIVGKPPRLVFASGPGKGSVISFATYAQGGARIAGGTKHRMILDEPPPEAFFGEAAPRLLRHGAHLRIGFTPVPGMADVRYLRKMVEEEHTVEQVLAPLCEANCWPVGALRPWLTQAQIDAAVKLWPAAQRGIRVRGDWEPLTEGAWLDAFDDTCISEERPPPGAYLVVSGDHGTQPGKQRFVLEAFADRQGLRPRVWFLDEWAPAEFTLPEEDARAILAMLTRNGLKYDDVDDWVADRSAQTREGHVRKSNGRLATEIAALLKRKKETLRWIHTPRKYAGSVADGYALFNALFARRDDGRPHGLVHPRCKSLIAGARIFQGKEQEPSKDVLDAARYGIERACTRREWLGLAGVPYQIGGT